MEVQERIKLEISDKELRENFIQALNGVNDIIVNNDYVLKIDGNEKLKIVNINWDYDVYLSKNARKNLAKRITNFNKKNSLKTINIMFLVFRKLGAIGENIKVNVSHKEQEINRLRKVYKLMRAKTEEARLMYQKEKGNFYK